MKPLACLIIAFISFVTLAGCSNELRLAEHCVVCGQVGTSKNSLGDVRRANWRAVYSAMPELPPASHSAELADSGERFDVDDRVYVVEGQAIAIVDWTPFQDPTNETGGVIISALEEDRPDADALGVRLAKMLQTKYQPIN